MIIIYISLEHGTHYYTVNFQTGFNACYYFYNIKLIMMQIPFKIFTFN